jgi:hypothetical protein
MPVPLPPESLADLQSGPFSFYPAIIGIERNEWVLRRATWTEVQVANTKTGEELWIPRRFLGELARVEGPVMIVGLLKELEYREGALMPHRRRVIEMPRAVNDRTLHGVVTSPADEAGAPRLAPVVAIRTEPDPPSPGHKLFRGSLAVGILACIGAGFVLRDVTPRSIPRSVDGRTRPAPSGVDFTSQDDYRTVTRKIGKPASDQWLRTESGAEYRRLWYPRRGFSVILTGTDHGSAHYAGSLASDGSILHLATPALLREIAPAALR